jgi:hypothetical protein
MRRKTITVTPWGEKYDEVFGFEISADFGEGYEPGRILVEKRNSIGTTPVKKRHAVSIICEDLPTILRASTLDVLRKALFKAAKLAKRLEG